MLEERDLVRLDLTREELTVYIELYDRFLEVRKRRDDAYHEIICAFQKEFQEIKNQAKKAGIENRVYIEQWDPGIILRRCE